MEFLPNKLFTEEYEFIDLSYPLNSDTIFWPGGEGFTLCMNCVSSPEHGYDYAAGCFTCAEHGGTHVDAPFHFNKDGITVDLIPLKQLIGKLRIVDIKEKCCNSECMQSRDYCLTAEDILLHESLYGKLENDDIVIIRTGWHRFYEDGPKAYLGFDEKIDGKYDENSRLSFPGIGNDAATLFVERRVAAVGLDTASLDAGKSQDFAAHTILLTAGIYGIENINGEIEKMPPVGSFLMVMPLKITGGSGSPSRIIGLIPKTVVA